ncbi:hypothetical protein SDC9_144937 [bioreactor metagenome]|uniref:Uncharacterized protein n=1 Tax=bioreactor metagenome TaxID=1076179 RepID=A0A645E7N3_9ZZZZ
MQDAVEVSGIDVAGIQISQFRETFLTKVLLSSQLMVCHNGIGCHFTAGSGCGWNGNNRNGPEILHVEGFAGRDPAMTKQYADCLGCING